LPGCCHSKPGVRLLRTSPRTHRMNDHNDLHVVLAQARSIIDADARRLRISLYADTDPLR
jgi:hypothetical protein